MSPSQDRADPRPGRAPVGSEPGATLRATGLRKSFGPPERRRSVLNGVDLNLPAVSVTVVRADPEAGATTLVRCLGLTYRPEGGSLTWTTPSGEVDLATVDARTVAWVRRRLVVASDGDLVAPPRRTVRDVLDRALGAHRPNVEDAGDLLARAGLDTVANDAVGAASPRDRTLLATLVALARRPAVVLLDEPFTGLTPNAASTVGRMVTSARDEGAAVLLTEPTAAVNHRPLPVDHLYQLKQGRIGPQ